MRIVTLFIAFLLPVSALAATEPLTGRARRAAIDAKALEDQCKKEKGYTEEQLKRGTFIELLRKCVAAKVNEIEQAQTEEVLARERAEFVDKATKSFQARFRGTVPTRVDTRTRTSVVKSRAAAVRQSTRARRASARASTSTSEKPLTTETVTPEK